MGKYDVLFDEPPKPAKAGKYAALFEGDEDPAKKGRAAGTLEDPFTSVEELTNRYPDNLEASRLYNDPQAQAAKVQAGQRAAYREGSTVPERMAAGAGRFAYGFVPGKNAGAEREAFDVASAGDLPTLAGRLAPEIALAAAAGAPIAAATRGAVTAGAARLVNPIARAAFQAGAQGAAYGAPSVALHQLQSVTEGRGLDPKGGLGEMALSILLPAAGGAGGQWMRGQAPGVLRSAVKPVLNQMDTPNPPNFERALERELVPYVGGLEASEGRARAVARVLGTQRDAAARAASTLPNSRPGSAVRVPFIQGALQDSYDDLGRQMQNPRTQLLADDYDEAIRTLGQWEDEFARRTSARGGNMSVEDALGFRQRIDDQIDWRRVNQTNTPGFDHASSILRRRLNERIAQASPETGRLTGELADVVPYEQALARRNMQAGNNYRMGLLDLGALGAGGTIGGLSGAAKDSPGEGALLGALGLLAGRRLFSTPGGAAMLYNTGRSLTEPSNLRNVVLQALRSGGNEAYSEIEREELIEDALERALNAQAGDSLSPSDDSLWYEGVKNGLGRLNRSLAPMK